MQTKPAACADHTLHMACLGTGLMTPICTALTYADGELLTGNQHLGIKPAFAAVLSRKSANPRNHLDDGLPSVHVNDDAHQLNL